jgi:hypothetical protein
MAGNVDDNSTSARPLVRLNELLAFVTHCLKSEVAAKKTLLDYFAENPIEWCCETKVVGRPQDIMEIEPEPPKEVIQGDWALDRFFWRGCDQAQAQFDIDWEASSVSYEGPVISVTFCPDDRGGNQAKPSFDGRWRVKIYVSGIRINAAPIIMWLRALGLLPAAVACSPPASAPLSPSSQLPPKPVPSPPKPSAAQESPPPEEAGRQEPALLSSEPPARPKRHAIHQEVWDEMESKPAERGKYGYATKLWNRRFKSRGYTLHTIQNYVAACRKEFRAIHHSHGSKRTPKKPSRGK